MFTSIHQSVSNLSSTVMPYGLPGYNGTTGPNTSNSEIQTVLSIVFVILGAMSVLFITLSGVRYVMSGGDPQKTAKAKDGIIYALVGLAVAILAEAIVNFVLSKS